MAARKQKLEEIQRNFARVREIRTHIAEQCEENARAQSENAHDQEENARQLREVREKTDRHIERLERGFEEDTGKISLPPKD